MATKKRGRAATLHERMDALGERLAQTRDELQAMRKSNAEEFTQLHGMRETNRRHLQDFDRRLTQEEAANKGLRSDHETLGLLVEGIRRYVGFKQVPGVARGATMEEIDAVIASYGGPGIETRTGNAIKAIAIELKARRLRDLVAQEPG